RGAGQLDLELPHLRPPRPHHRGRRALGPPGPGAASPTPAHAMSGELVVAVLSSAVALASVAISVWSARSTARLQDELEERRRQASKEELVEEVMSRYREPPLRAAFGPPSGIHTNG